MTESSPNERLKNVIERLIMLPVRVSHWRQSRAKHKIRIEALRAVHRTLKIAAQLKASNTTTVFNVAMYLLLLDQDIAYFTDDLVYAIGDRRRVFLAKYESLLLYEAAEDLPQLLGREFRDAVKGLGASDQHLARVNSVSSNLNHFWRTHREFLGTIRNVLAAHRDHDSLRYAEALEGLKPLEVMTRAAELSQLLEQLATVIMELSPLTVGHAAVIRDIVTSSEKRVR